MSKPIAPKPSLGRIVHVFVDSSTNNGSDIAPAIVTRVWNDHCVNLRVLGDSDTTHWWTSVALFDTREAVEAKHAELPEETRPKRPFGAFWPPYV